MDCIGWYKTTKWRRARDSNPRYPFRYAGFQDRSHQPLGQLSVLPFYEENPGSSPGFSQEVILARVKRSSSPSEMRKHSSTRRLRFERAGNLKSRSSFLLQLKRGGRSPRENAFPKQ